MPASRLLRFLTASAALLLVLGCGSEGIKVKLVPVSGKITLDGNPMPTGTVVFQPEDANQKYTPSGIIENGTYKLLTDGKDGAPLGKYRVSVNAQGMGMGGTPADVKGTTDPTKTLGGKSSMNSKYSSPTTSGIVIEVVESPAAGAYDLKVTK